MRPTPGSRHSALPWGRAIRAHRTSDLDEPTGAPIGTYALVALYHTERRFGAGSRVVVARSGALFGGRVPSGGSGNMSMRVIEAARRAGQRPGPRASAVALRRRSVSPMLVSRSALRSATLISRRSKRRKYHGMSRTISKDSVTVVPPEVGSNR